MVRKLDAREFAGFSGSGRMARDNGLSKMQRPGWSIGEMLAFEGLPDSALPILIDIAPLGPPVVPQKTPRCKEIYRVTGYIR
ncbi:MAG: hypothetical protein JWQ49_1450 [Edaphobacter sp.]|nr:hypothetical protein [Edaphobacter sp.]